MILEMVIWKNLYMHLSLSLHKTIDVILLIFKTVAKSIHVILEEEISADERKWHIEVGIDVLDDERQSKK